MDTPTQGTPPPRTLTDPLAREAYAAGFRAVADARAGSPTDDLRHAHNRIAYDLAGAGEQIGMALYGTSMMRYSIERTALTACASGLKYLENAIRNLDERLRALEDRP